VGRLVDVAVHQGHVEVGGVVHYRTLSCRGTRA
jgi:flavin-binding protein dodecin